MKPLQAVYRRLTANVLLLVWILFVAAVIWRLWR